MHRIIQELMANVSPYTKHTPSLSVLKHTLDPVYLILNNILWYSAHFTFQEHTSMTRDRHDSSSTCLSTGSQVSSTSVIG